MERVRERVRSADYPRRENEIGVALTFTGTFAVIMMIMRLESIIWYILITNSAVDTFATREITTQVRKGLA